jgi:nicotinamidase/pyrazinamidase
MKALILVDIQNDFLPGGALPVPRGDEVVPVANALIDSGRFKLIVATQDWHPANHGSFASQYVGKAVGEVIQLAGLPQVLWPDHCVQDTGGALFAPGLNTRAITRVFHKGTNPQIDSYSGFYDNGHRKGTGLAEYLRGLEVKEVCIVGLATDYCVKFTALDARRLGFETTVVIDGVRGVDLRPGDSERAIEEMRAAGVSCVGLQELLARGRATGRSGERAARCERTSNGGRRIVTSASRTLRS